MNLARRLKSIISLTSPRSLVNGGTTTWSRDYNRASRSRAENLHKIKPKLPREQLPEVAESLYNVIRRNAPLTIGATWDLIKEGGVNGLNSKTNMKLMLKWMRAKAMLKLLCNHVGSTKRFLLVTRPDDPNLVLPTDSMEPQRKQHKKNTKKAAKLKLRKKIKKEQTQKQKQQR